MSSKDPLKFVIQINDGEPMTFDMVPGAGDEFSFAIGTPRRHGVVWKIKANRNKNDLYLMWGKVGKSLKLSYHQTKEGPKWWFQWTSEHMKENPQLKREIDNWISAESGVDGWGRGLTVVTRHQDVVPAPADESLEDVLWLPPPLWGNVIGVHIVTASANDNLVINSTGRMVPAFALANGQAILLAITMEKISDEESRNIDAEVAKIAGALPGAPDAKIRFQERHRALVWGHAPDGAKRAWDVALGKPPVLSRLWWRLSCRWWFLRKRLVDFRRRAIWARASGLQLADESETIREALKAVCAMQKAGWKARAVALKARKAKPRAQP